MEYNCGNCKYWEERDDYGVKAVNVNKCTKVKMFWDCTGWDDDMDRVLTVDFKDSKAFVQDGSDYKAWLLTKEEFYCNQHKTKT